MKALLEMRQERSERRARIGTVRMQAELAERSGQMVIEVEGLTKGYGGAPVIADLSMRIMRRDRVGLVGPNGSGKTTLLRLLVGELAPDAGHVRQGANLQIAYFDQQREQLDPERTVVDTVADGHDTVTVGGQSRHVHGYLRDFLFPPERALSKVKALSGGERNRLLLARLFTRPANLLVMDEPTNDLDIETLELLEAQLVDWPGTLLLVSHDRAFIDSVVTSTLVFEGQGRVEEYVGGYEDWLHQRREIARAKDAAAAADRSRTPVRQAGTKSSTAARKRSYREEQELLTIPRRIEELEAEQQTLSAAVADPGFYKEGTEAIHHTLARLEALQREILDAYARWDELDSRGT